MDLAIWPLSPIVVRFSAENRQKMLVWVIRRAILEHGRDYELRKRLSVDLSKELPLSGSGRGGRHRKPPAVKSGFSGFFVVCVHFAGDS